MRILLATLKSHRCISGDIDRGIKLYKDGGDVSCAEFEATRDGRSLKSWCCRCTKRYKKPPLCRHVIAAVLEKQGGIAESPLNLGKTDRGWKSHCTCTSRRDLFKNETPELRSRAEKRDVYQVL